MRRFGLACALLLAIVTPSPGQDGPRTVAESSDYTRTGTHADVMEFLRTLDAQSDRATLGSIGTSTEGRDIPVLWVGDPVPEDAAQARKDKKLVALLIGNIHAGEVCGKEALQMLAREIALGEESPLLKDYVIAFVPIYNADGNDKMGPDNRPGQVGPEEMGERPNGQGLDLNRDFVKMEAPETRALAKLVRDWDPDLIVDTHTTNGSHHRYALTYAGPMNPAGDQKVVEFVRDTLLPAVTKTVEEEDGWATYFYGNFDRAHEAWSTYSGDPRFAAQYRGLRNRVAVLTEAYSYAPYKDRVLATRDFVRAVLEYGAAHKDEIRKLEREADERTIKAGEGTPTGEVPIRWKMSKTFEDVPLKGWVMEDVEGRRPEPTDEPTEHVVDVYASFEPELSVTRPWAYCIPASRTGIVENLLRHGIEVRELREDVEVVVDAYRIDEVRTAPRPFQGHTLTTLEATATPLTKRLAAGSYVVPTAQKLGTLAVVLLEPQSQDGLATWEAFGELAEGDEFPVTRLASEVALLTLPARPLDEDREFGRRVTYDLYSGRRRPDFDGSPAWGFDWQDGEHYAQTIDGKRVLVHAPTGGREPADEQRPDLVEALAALPWLEADEIRRQAWRLRVNGAGTGALLDWEDDLYWVAADASSAKRLTFSPQPEEMAEFSPDGRFVAFVRDNDLWVADVETAGSGALTTGGHDTLRYGKHDWVYFEELYGRSWKAFWWSPDSSRLLLFETDASMMKDFTIVDNREEEQRVETVRYPNPGERNPHVRVGVLSAAGGPIRWIDLSKYDDGAYLVSAAGFTPDGKRVWLCVQDRAQTWMDVLFAPANGGEPTRLFRETTEAWVEPAGGPRFLRDGSFLWFSERTGWKHLYHYTAKGELLGPVTEGEFEVRRIVHLDEDAGTLWFTGTKDSPVAENLYRVALAGGEIERLTTERGSHRVSVSPTGAYFVDSWSSVDDTARVALRNARGGFVRWIDTNPVRDLETFALGKREIVTIPGAEGQPELEAIITYPPELDEGGPFPVWFMTYGGPHAPTISDAWSRSYLWDQLLASTGVIAFRADPYSASGKGAQSTWTAYERFGQPECRDIEHAIRWITANDFADASRVGMNGHSYGGFMTAYMLTHSKLFSAGIAGAPVTDWRLYDTIYTERYMNTPMANPDGYDATSVTKAAKDLHGRLLILHGTMDDNVHMQNSLQLVDALQREGKMDFEMFVYPGYRHGIYGTHYQRTIWDFIQRTMKVGEYAPEPAPSEPDSLADEPAEQSGP